MDFLTYQLLILGCLTYTVDAIPYPGDNADLDRLVHYYFDMGYKRYEIIGYLLFVHHISVSLTTLKRILKKLGLRRYNCESSVLLIRSKIHQLRSAGYIDLGYKSLWKISNTQCDVRATQSTVRLLLKQIDPAGVLLRSRRRLRRRIYISRGPNYVIHIDSYDKLLPYGFPIHGAIDGFSRKVLWLRVLPSNKNPRYVAGLYMEYLLKIKNVPRMVRSDAGSENYLIKDKQTLLRFHHPDRVSGHKSFSMGRSTANQRIESFWSSLMRNFTQYWRNFFKDLIDMNIFNNANFLHLQCIRFCFIDIIQKRLDEFVLFWNSHRIRAQRDRDVPTGVPDVMYYQSVLYGGTNHVFPLPCTLLELDRLANELCEPIPFRGCNERFLHAVGQLTEMDPYNVPYPESTEQATALFKGLNANL